MEKQTKQSPLVKALIVFWLTCAPALSPYRPTLTIDFAINEHKTPIVTIVSEIYGTATITEPVLVELIAHPLFQRLRNLHQLGHCFYGTNGIAFTRFEHSLGVFLLARLHHAPLDEQIAALIHDISHAAFSHSSAFLATQNTLQADAQQDAGHVEFIQNSPIATTLAQYGYTAHDIAPKENHFQRLEQELPAACADRLDYNIQEALHRNLITIDEAHEMLQELHFDDDAWYFTSPKMAHRWAECSLYLTENSWGGHLNCVTCIWFGAALRRAVEQGIATKDSLAYATDDIVWQRMRACNDAILQQELDRVQQGARWYTLDAEHPDIVLFGKFRGFDPLVKIDEHTYVPLTSIDEEFRNHFIATKKLIAGGWPIKYIQQQ
jgi:hypothetical protein